MPIGFLGCGPSGVGKTSHFKEMLHQAGIKNVQLFDPDVRSEPDHADRSAGALKDVQDAIEAGESFGYTATCAAVRIIKDLIKRMKAKKYRIVIAIVYTDLPTALKRIDGRSQKVPGSVVEDLHAYFKKQAEKYMKMDVDLYLYNNQQEFSLLLSRKNKKIVCRSGDTDFYFDISKYCS